MAVLSKTQMAMYATAAGLPGSTFAEIGDAESSGRTDVVNSIGCVGVWQINQPVHISDHPSWTVAWLKDPGNNARAAKYLYDADKAAGGSGLRPWLDSQPTWGPKVGAGGGAVQASNPCDLIKGEGRKYCLNPDDKGGGGDPFGAPDLPDVQGFTEAAAQIGRLAQAIAKAGNWLSNPANWVRIVYVAGGGLLALAAANIVMRPYIGPISNAIPGPIRRQAHRVATRNEEKESA